ncbi:MAG: DUF3999 domain-containing protein [Acidobacteriota bacterium]|nr:DUF3999 domain-containing protein [Acidobacteriota bacterium]
MKPALLLALLLWQSAPPPNQPSPRQNFRFERTLSFSAPASGATPGQTCVILDPALFPNAAPSLKDLRLFDQAHQESREIPYAITLSEPQQPDPDSAQIRNLSLRQHAIVFDLEMPHRPYTELVLNLAGHNFLATATVSGTRNPDYTHQAALGAFTLFDLSGQHLSRSTTIPLQETDLPYLHIELTLSAAPGTPAFTLQSLLKIVQGVTVPPSREAQSLYTTAAVTSSITQRNRKSIAAFTLAERIPIDRVSFDLDPSYKSNFSRDIHITDRPLAPEGDASPELPGDNLPANSSDDRNEHPTSIRSGNPADNPSETLAGTIFRVYLTQAGHEIRQQQLSVPATLGSNMQSPASVEVAIDNGDDLPLPVTSVRLETRQRKLCFDALSSSPLTLFYGDPALNAPQYDYTRLWTPSPKSQTANLGPEQLNPAYRTPADTRTFTERHPHLLWFALLVVLCILGFTAFRSSRTLRH